MSTLIGGLGIGLFTVGLVGMSVFGFVSSAEAAQKTAMSIFDDASLRQVMAEELVTRIEESGDSPQEKIVFSIAKPLIDNAVMKALSTPVLRDFAGDISFAAYEVYVEEKPSRTVDLSPMIDAAMGAIRDVDPRIAKQFTPKVDPIEIKREPDSPNLKTLRDNGRLGLWIVVVLGLLLEVLAWFLSTATAIRKVFRLGIRLVVAGVAVVFSVVVARQQTFGVAADKVDVVGAVVGFVSSPVYTRGIVMVIIGSVISLCCCLKTSSLKKKLLQP